MMNQEPVTEEQKETVKKLREELKRFDEPIPPYFYNVEMNEENRN